MSTIRSVPLNQAINQAPRTVVEALKLKNNGELPAALTEQDLVDLKGIFKPESREAMFLSTQLVRFFASSKATTDSSGAVVGMMTKDQAKTAMGLVSSLIAIATGSSEDK
ncbi:MAG: hypothetical protein IT381_01880 [Deltaproteobacteria bacterium]|nr:hypothetical protein [Deltaproteobacteria bacterium]